MKVLIPKKGERVEIASRYINKANYLLDIGCGEGIISYFIKNKVRKIYGIDNYEILLEKAKRRGLRVKNVDLGRQTFPFGDNFFDVITCLDVIEHVKNPPFLLQEAYRVLKNKGLFIISTPNIRFSDHLFALIFKGVFPKTSLDRSLFDGGHIHFFTFKDLELLLKSAGFKAFEREGIINKEKRGWKGRFLERILGKKFMLEFRSPGILLVAKK